MSPRESLLQDGYTVFRALLDAATLDALREVSAAALAALPAEHRERNRSQGSLVPVAEHPGYSPVLRHPALARVFGELGFADPRFSSGDLISKPPGGPPLFWHQDWWGWDDPISYSDTVAQVFVMIYLSDTTVDNGCLRVVPDSHRRRHALHEAPTAHGEELSRVDDPDDPLYGVAEGELAVPVTAGDVIVGGARLLHAAHANRSGAERGLITLWYHPEPGALPESMQARIRGFFDRTGTDTDAPEGAPMTLADWPDADALARLFPPRSTASSHPMVREATPGRMLG